MATCIYNLNGYVVEFFRNLASSFNAEIIEHVLEREEESSCDDALGDLWADT